MTLLEILVGGRMRHEGMHNVKRSPQVTGVYTPTIFFTSKLSLGTSDGSTASTTLTALATDVRTGATSAFTTLTETFVETIAQPGTTVISTYTSGVAVTDSAQYSSLRASETAESTFATSTATATSSNASTTSSAAAKSSSSGSVDTLVPAIVVPVVVVLVASLALFWWIMRRRHQRQLEEEPEFVMATKPEKSLARSMSNTSATSSTRELVPMSKLEKEMAVHTTEDRSPATQFFPPTYATADIGVARPMTPPDKSGINSGASTKPAVPNFSSVRPGTAGRARPSQDFSLRNPNQNGPRSQNSPESQARGREISQASRGPPRRGESPFMAGSRGAGPRSRPGDGGTRSRPRTPMEHQPSPLNTNINVMDPTLLPKPLNPPPPGAAFAGLSPVSQYSPLVQDANNTTHNPTTSSSKTGYNNNINPTQLLLPERQSKADSLPSPELPPPLTREDMPPRLFSKGRDSPAGGSSVYPSPAVGTEFTPRIAGGPSQVSLVPNMDNQHAREQAGEHRLSMISRISSDDEYVDMEIDNKSDVSSLDEREKWEIESDRQNSSSRLATGYGSAGMSPVEGPTDAGSRQATKKTNGSSNLRDRDSEGPFVLSRY